MNFLNLAKRFHKDEDGAVTVDWVVLTAAVVGLGLLVIQAVRPGVTGLANTISDAVAESQIGPGAAADPEG